MKKFFLVAILFSIINIAYPQKIKVIDTDFSKGKLAHIQTIRYSDLVKFHGHSCDGLLEGWQALELALNKLYPEGIIDRTNTRIVCKPSPCIADVAIFLTGGRYQYNTFYVSKDFEGLYIVQRIDNGLTIQVLRNDNVKPAAIDSLGNLAIMQKLSYEELQNLRKLEDQYAAYLRKTPSNENFTLRILLNFQWNPILNNEFIKTDIINKHITN
jgi:acetolactate decarboxylase